MIPFLWYSERQNYKGKSQISVCEELEMKGGDGMQGVLQDFWVGDETLYSLIVMVFNWMHTFVKIHKAVHVRRENFILYKL